MINALLLFLPTTILAPLHLYFIVALLCLPKIKWSDFQTPIFKCILVIVILSLLNLILKLVFGRVNIEFYDGILPFPYALYFIPTYIIAKKIDRKTLLYILIFIILEIGVGLFEYLIGRTTVLGSSVHVFAEDETMFYFKRVYGLSANSSALAGKVLFALIITYVIRPKYIKITLSILLLGLFITFNRTTIIASLPLWIYFYFYFTKKLSYRKGIHIAVIMIAIFIITKYSMDILTQFRMTDISLKSLVDAGAGRDEIYTAFWKEFTSNFFTGNGSVRLWLDTPSYNEGTHAHNSFLETLASNGFIIAMLYFYLIFFFIKKENFIPILSLIIMSLAQYGLLWGLSFGDIIFLMLIVGNLDSLKVKKEIQYLT